MGMALGDTGVTAAELLDRLARSLDYHHSLGVACTCPEHRLLVGYPRKDAEPETLPLGLRE